MSKFKAGDLVFEFNIVDYIGLYVLAESNDEEGFPVETKYRMYTDEGRDYMDDELPNIFHANPATYNALVTLYGEKAVPQLPSEAGL